MGDEVYWHVLQTLKQDWDVSPWICRKGPLINAPEFLLVNAGRVKTQSFKWETRKKPGNLSFPIVTEPSCSGPFHQENARVMSRVSRPNC